MAESDAPVAPAADPNNEPVAPATPTPPAAEPGVLPANDPNGESASQAEIDSALKNSGIKLPEAAPAAAVDDEEGDEPDEPAAPATDDKDEAADDKPQPAKPATPAAPDAATADDKYSFQIEDANGATFKISADAKMEDILAEFEPKNNGQILDILEQLRGVKDQKAADEAQAAEDKTAEDRRTRASALLEGWQEEAKVLQGDKRIPEGGDGDKRINAVYKFMADENDARMKAGKPTLNSFEDALDKLENKEARDKIAADAKAEKETARKNGAKVGGASAPASSGTPVYKAGSARNANQALRSMGIIE